MESGRQLYGLELRLSFTILGVEVAQIFTINVQQYKFYFPYSHSKNFAINLRPVL